MNLSDRLPGPTVAKKCRIGQPVLLAEEQGHKLWALRIAAGARLITDAAAASIYSDLDHTVAKLDLILDHLAYLSGYREA